MLRFCRTIISLMCLIAVTGCDKTASSIPAKAKVQDPIAADIDRMEANIRIAAANKRIDELEHQVGALQATPEKLNLELLTQRVEALEVKDHGDASSPGMSSEKSVSNPDQIPKPFSKQVETRQSKSQRTSRANMLDLETKPRQAKGDEAKAVNRTR